VHSFLSECAATDKLSLRFLTFDATKKLEFITVSFLKMFLSRRMSDNTERSAGLRAWISPLFKISYQNIEISAVLIDILLIVFASVAGAAIYQYTWLDEIVGANVFLGIGVTSSFICIYVMHARGLYRFPVLLNPVPYLAAIFTVLTLVGLAVTAALHLYGRR
jgi:hypothetical protein